MTPTDTQAKFKLATGIYVGHKMNKRCVDQ